MLMFHVEDLKLCLSCWVNSVFLQQFPLPEEQIKLQGQTPSSDIHVASGMNLRLFCCYSQAAACKMCWYCSQPLENASPTAMPTWRSGGSCLGHWRPLECPNLQQHPVLPFPTAEGNPYSIPLQSSGEGGTSKGSCHQCLRVVRILSITQRLC